MKLGYVTTALEAIDAVLYETNDEGKGLRRLPFKLRYKLTKIKDALQKDAEFAEEERIRLVHEFGTEVEVEGEKRVEIVDEEKRKEFFKAYNEVLFTDIDTVYQRIDDADLEPISEVAIDMTDPQMQVFMAFLVSSADKVTE